MLINSIYTTFNGEQNPWGIGSPTIFLRTAGCHIRCYAKSLGILCDTPEALEKTSGEDMPTRIIVEKLREIREETGISLVCVTGGDPLWRKPDDLLDLFGSLTRNGFNVTVETSGTIDVRPFIGNPMVHFIVDYKLKSAAVKGNKVDDFAPYLRSSDYIKFVVYDEADYDEMLAVVKNIDTKAVLCAGLYWGTPHYSVFEFFNKMVADGICQRVQLNAQMHKMAQSVIFDKEIDPLT